MGQVKRAACVYNFTTGDKAKILTDAFPLASANYPVANFLVQVTFTGLEVGSAATVYLMISNDNLNFIRVTGKEFVIAGAGTISFLIPGEANLAAGAYAQLGISGVAGNGSVKSVYIGTI